MITTPMKQYTTPNGSCRQVSFSQPSVEQITRFTEQATFVSSRAIDAVFLFLASADDVTSALRNLPQLMFVEFRGPSWYHLRPFTLGPHMVDVPTECRRGLAAFACDPQYSIERLQEFCEADLRQLDQADPEEN